MNSYKMIADSVLIDDDVEMEPVLIIDEDDVKINTGRTNCVETTVDTIILDDESVPSDSTEPVNNDNTITNNKSNKFRHKSETAFINSLKTNTLLNKIVTKCLNMENSHGMPRIINKTLLPLYRDADSKFKESKLFRKLLKKTFKLLVRDPDYKFLHIKTLCEEIKSGTLRRKVPFVTLATNLKHNGARGNTDGSNSSTGINKTVQNNRSIISTIVNENNQSENSCDTGIIPSLEENNRFGTVFNDNNKSDTAIVENNNNRNNYGTVVNKKNKETNTWCTHVTENRKENNNTGNRNQKTDVINLDNSDTESIINLDNDDVRNEIIFIEETTCSDNGIDNSNKENNKFENQDKKLKDDDLKYELLIPQDHVEVIFNDEVSDTPSINFNKVAELEREIATYKRMITVLEEAEVTSDNAYNSQYIQCSNFKKRIVECYKKLCQINGTCEKLVKRQEVRLHVAEGHPAGPAKNLETFLNDTIDNTGKVSFPDFSDVVNCVYNANFDDKLGWNGQRIFQEALVLFRECGQALRKRRQKREYRDLLSLVRDQNNTDDPAEKDAILQAKLEENRLIAKAKEEEMLERYVNMENHNNTSSERLHPRLGNIVELKLAQDNSDSDSDDSEQDQVSKNELNINSTTETRNTCEIGESSKNNESINDNGNSVKVLIVNGSCNLNDIQKYIFCKSDRAVVQNHSTNKPEDDTGENEVAIEKEGEIKKGVEIEKGVVSKKGVEIEKGVEIKKRVEIEKGVEIEMKVKMERGVEIKKEPLDIQSMFDELGDSFVSTVFDIEDPFLVIEISSDGFSDDDS